jgi:hypothetical protein
MIAIFARGALDYMERRYAAGAAAATMQIFDAMRE